MEPLSEQLLTQIACLDPVYVDGVLGILNLGATFTVAYYRWQPVKSEKGLWIYEKNPSLAVVAPHSAVLTPNGVVAKALAAQRAPGMIRTH